MEATSKDYCGNCKYCYEPNTFHYSCDYYLITGKHRMDDFGRKKHNNEWLKCDKFEPRGNRTPERMKRIQYGKGKTNETIHNDKL